MLCGMFFAAAAFLSAFNEKSGGYAICDGIGPVVYGTAAAQRGSYDRERGRDGMFSDADSFGDDPVIL